MKTEGAMNRTTFSGQVVIITGGAGGLGQAMVRAFADAGARVVCADLATLAADACRGFAGEIHSLRLDVTDEDSWIELLDRVEAEFGPLDVLVNNAGFYRPNIPFEDMALAVWRKHFAINADGVFLGCKHAILRMKARGQGAIVNIGSGLSLTPNASGAAYCGSKAAVLMTTRTAAAAAGQYGIRVNAVLPGAVPTDMLWGNLRDGESEAEFVVRMEGYSALGKLATPDDIARGVLFLADPASSAITGIYLPVDGGNIR